MPEVETILELYSVWLEKKGYLDTDWYTEEPKAIEEFMKYYNKILKK